MGKRPTINDLAQAAGVSVATVDRVLNGRLPVKQATALRVVSAAEAIGYHATGLLKRRLAEVPRRTFGFLLQRRNAAFYQSFGAALAAATSACNQVEGRAVVEYVEDLVPQQMAQRLRDFAMRVDAVAIVAVDHPAVNHAVEEISALGKPVFTLLSDVTTEARKCYLAVDSRKAGRTAAWTIARLARRPGKVAILLGTHRYLSQEVAETGFRSYLREHAPDFELMEPAINLEDDRISYEVVTDILASNPDLAGIYVAGGGQDGMINALRDEKASGTVIAVCNELTAANRAALVDGTITMALRTPIEAMAARTAELMAAASGASDMAVPTQVLFPAEIFISENV
jgi:LacI family transcriptional regulator